MINLPLHLKLAHSTYDAMCRQERDGVKFDVEAAKKLVIYIDNRMTEIEAEVEPKLPQREPNKTELKGMTPPKIQFKKDGTPSAACLKWFDAVEVECPDEWTSIYYGRKGDKWVELPHHEPIIQLSTMRLKHQGALKDWLLSIGWVPLFWNVKKDKKSKPIRDDRGQLIKTSPKFHENGNICPNLELLGDAVEIVRPVIEWLSLRNRRSVIINEEKGTGWLNHPRLKIDGRLPAASSGWTNTGREKHRGVANIPRVSSYLGKEMRSLFCAPEGRVLVGYDAKSIEARVKGHFCAKYDGGAYAEKILSEGYDEHIENAGLWGCERSEAKTPGYALQYFCGLPTFCKALGVSEATGSSLYDAYWETNWALKKVDEAVAKFWENDGKKKYILTIDEGKVMTRSRHSITNALFQSTGAKIMRMAGHLMKKYVELEELNAFRVVAYHDEYIWESSPEDAKRVLELGIKSIVNAGKFFKMAVPLDADGHIGTNWSLIH